MTSHLPLILYLHAKVMAFVAPKIIGGARAPTPVGELGFVEMTQAVQLEHVTWQQVHESVGEAGLAMFFKP